jgi:hypothetical protein
MNPLLEKYLNATLTADEAAALAQAFAENPALADEFAAATRTETELRCAFKEQAQTALYNRRMERAAEESEAPARRRSWTKPLAAAAGFALLAGGGLAFLQFRQAGTAQQKPAPRGKVSGIPSPLADAGTAVSGDSTSRADAASVKHKLRRFVAGSAMLRSVPVSQALSSLEAQWKSFDHRDPRDKDAVAFTVAEAVLQTWANPDDEPRVNLEIPGISLLTSVELIAAQAGLRAAVTPAGVTLEPEKRADDGKPRTWNLPLPAETFTAFLARVGSGTERARQKFVQNSLTYGFLVLHQLEQSEPSWMGRKVSTPEVVLERSDVRLGSLSWEEVKIVDADSGGFTNREEFAATSYDPPQDAASFTPPGLPSHAWNAQQVDFTGQPMQTIDDLIADASRVQQIPASGSGFETTYDPTVRQVEATFSEDGQTIDLTLAPEIMEFEGFLNYGEPIQTTGINALGQNEPVILTDSGITQPVFATRTLVDHPATLTNLLSAHGANTDGITWDETTGIITARGTLRELRTASAALAAVRESAGAGVMFQAKVLEWDSEASTPATESNILVTGAEVAALTRKAKKVIQMPALRTGIGAHAVLSGGGVASGWDDLKEPVTVAGGAMIHVNSAMPHGTSWIVDARFVHGEVITLTKNGGLDAEHSASQTRSITVPDGQWLRIDFPARGSAPAATLLLSVQGSAMP